MAKYVKQTETGTYEFGTVEVASDRKRDKLIREGEATTYEVACASAGVEPSARPTPPPAR